MLDRREDPSAISGVGHVADGVVFDDGTTVVRWRTEHRSTVTFDSLEDAQAIHGHGGQTRFVFCDYEGPVAWMCALCFAYLDNGQPWCDTCGATGTSLVSAKHLVEAIREHDEHRLTALKEQTTELQALRRLAYDLLGPEALGLAVVPTADGKGTFGARTQDRNAVVCVIRSDDETDAAYLARAAESVTLDADRLRRLAELPRGAR